MNEATLKIGSGDVLDVSVYGLFVIDSDKRFSSPKRKFEEIAVPELGKSSIHAVVVTEPFDYKITFGTVQDVNTVITQLEAAIGANKIEFTNLYTRTKIVGYLQNIQPVSSDNFYRSKDAESAEFEVSIRVNDPSLCNYNVIF